MACKTDPALVVVEAVESALLDWFGDGACPPKVGVTANVRRFAGDGAPLAAWDSHASQGCEEPFVWVRTMRRYRSSTFPAPTINTSPCGLPRVVAVELGVGWCAVVDQEPSWSEYATEADVSQDVSWRLEEALCMAARLISTEDGGRAVGTDTIAPYGPEGGVIAWTAVLYATF